MTNKETRRLEDLSVAELAALCGLEHDGCDKWTEPARSEYERRIVVPKSYSSLWNVWPHGTRGERIEAPSEHAALVALAKHLQVQPTEPPTRTPVAEPAPVQRGGNVALVMRAYGAWMSARSFSAAVDAAVEHTFGQMLAEAYVADAKEGA